MIPILLMEFNTELILLSDNISTSVILPLDNTSYSNINYCYYNNVYLSWDSYFSLNDNILFSYIENIESNNAILNIVKTIRSNIALSFISDLIISAKTVSSHIELLTVILSSLKVWNAIILSRVYLLSNISSNIIFKSSFLKGCTIPRLDIRNSLLIKYYGVIPRLAYKLISIGKRFFFFNNKFLSMKK